MTEKINVVVANPAGNTTIFVLTEVPVSRYQEITDRLLAIDFKEAYGRAFRGKDPEGKGIFREVIYEKEIRGEQVGFALPDIEDPQSGEKIFAINMSGLEFCGNAMRAFAFYKGTLTEPPLRRVRVRMSGCSDTLEVEIDPTKKDAAAQMPLPRFSGRFTLEQMGAAKEGSEDASGILVDMGGISHLVLRDAEPLPETFEAIKAYFYSREREPGAPGDFPAFGVMFTESGSERMTPVVYVKDVDTTYFEGSCASGTTAAAFVAAMDLPDGVQRLCFREPAGTLCAEVTKESGQAIGIRLSGLVELSDMISVTL